VIDPASDCANPESEAMTVVVNPDPTISATVNNAEVCIDGDATLTAVLTGGSTQAHVQWQSGTSPAGPWTNISGQTSATYASPTGVSGVFYYRASVVDPVSGCATPSTGATTVIVTPDATVSTVVNNPNICIGGTATLTATVTGGSSQRTLQWQSSPDGSAGWTDISGQTATTFAAPNSAAGTFYYRLQVNDLNNGCASPASNVITLVVHLTRYENRTLIVSDLPYIDHTNSLRSIRQNARLSFTGGLILHCWENYSANFFSRLL
jgi:hypothetical protein